MEDSELLYRIAFASVRGMGYDLANKILDVVSSEKEFFVQSEKSLREILGSRTKISEMAYRKTLLDKATKEVNFVEKNDIGVTYFTDISYPTRLANAQDAPILLYSKGKTSLNASKIISIVGTRHATPYGQHFCETFIDDIPKMLDDVVIVSGLAYGVDICVHRACVRNNVPTVAVLAHGLNTIYPAPHRASAIDIINHGGMLLTDYQTGDRIHPGNFVARNRIVAGLADCTVVVESAEKGGSLITAAIASSYNRDVFALPGRMSDVYSVGCNKIIRNNSASLITSASDMIAAMRWKKNDEPQKPQQKELFPDVSPKEQLIVDYLRMHDESHINIICNALGMPMSQLMSLLIELEFKGLIMSLPGGKYSLA